MMQALALFLVCVAGSTLVSAASVISKVPEIRHKVELELPVTGHHVAPLKDDVNCDALLDAILAELDPLISDEGYDPYYLVETDILDFIYVTGEILGLSEVKRKNNCTMTSGSPVKMTFEITVTDLDALLDLDITGLIPYEATAEVDYSEVDCDATAKVISNDSLTLTDFAVSYLSECDIVISGLGIFDYLADLISSTLCDLLDGLISDIFDGVIEDLINDLLQNLTPEQVSIGHPRLPTVNQKVGRIHRALLRSSKGH